ncbi:hypothetical protein TMS3_0117130 [Pseudomonas taeanensis MS-3]|uniref:Alginate biosynthesis protein AlgX n=1 Tax=Pseudomonas taeanensis MS-3 TaxID=1395571 RepID=A0A0A1YH03_9PSED|nr:alginate biosynthesis protein AlgX [Pseudomonas taeanensis]KFX69185.1 hypothetical protein TMS3_0117130 [Pseudomonas taeanensis MS-3]
MNRASMLLGVGLLVGASHLPAAPIYQAEACCQLCPAAADTRAYQAAGLRGYGRLIEAQDGWLFSSAQDLRTEFGLSQQSYKQLKRLRNALKHRGVELMLVYPPSRGLLHADKLTSAERTGFDQARAQASYRATLGRMRDLGIWVPDLASLMQAEAESRDYFFKADQHWTPQGAERTALLVAQTAKKIPLFDQLPVGKYQSSPAGLMARSGSLHKVAQRLCGNGYPRQYVQSFITQPISSSPSQQAQVVLVGSSNSSASYNFAGFLEQHLGTPVHNASLHGSSHEGALLQYLLSEAFQKQPPKLLIWELGDAASLGRRNLYRQVVPAVSNGCSGRPALLQSSGTLRAGANQVLFNGANGVLPIRSSDYRIDLQFDDPAVQQLSATLTFMNGRQETLTFNRAPGDRQQGRILLELREDGDWDELTFLSLNVQPLAGVSGNSRLTTKLCQVRSDEDGPGLRTAQTSVER